MSNDRELMNANRSNHKKPGEALWVWPNKMNHQGSAQAYWDILCLYNQKQTDRGVPLFEYQAQVDQQVHQWVLQFLISGIHTQILVRPQWIPEVIQRNIQVFSQLEI